MAYMDKLKNSKPKKSSEAEADQDMDALMGEEDSDIDALLGDDEGDSPMAAMSDDELMAEMEKRGFTVSKKEDEESPEGDESIEDLDFESLS